MANREEFPLPEEDFDVVVLGTGLKECILSGLLSVAGMKVLHLDRNSYYGGESASLNLVNLFNKFRGANEIPSTLGSNRDYSVDLIPKCIMACGKLVKMLLHTKVTRYLDFKVIDGSYVFKDGNIFKVPATPDEAIRSSLMGMFEKRRFRNFIVYVNDWDANDPSTHKGFDANQPMRALYEKFGLDSNTQRFIGHAMALRLDDSYLDQPARPTIESIQLYCYSLTRYGKSPYIYPLYGLGGLPEAFSRLCAINGGTFMLNKDIDEIIFDESGKATGVRSGEQTVSARFVVGDPSYFPEDKCRVVGRVIRSICILSHPIPNTNNASSAQIIIPASTVGRNSDIFLNCVSHAHCIAPAGKWVAIVSTTVETDNPEAEVEPGIALLGPIDERFDHVVDTKIPVDDGTSDGCFISTSYDATSHFETTSEDVLFIYQRITGSPLDLSVLPDTQEEE